MIKHDRIRQVIKNLQQAFVGEERFLEQVMITVLSGGHLLLEDKPGVGKTTLANALARVLGCDFGRIQFTPDTMPGDVLGVSVYSQEKGVFSYLPGPVMHQVLLADEINRTSPKTQSSLLEAMEEGQVTVDGTVYPLPRPFFVIATQNPTSFAGTYPLPEAQLDRFFMRLSIGYPSKEQAKRLVEMKLSKQSEQTCKAEAMQVLTSQEWLAYQEQVCQVKVSETLIDYLVRITDMTREPERFKLGASPRAMLALLRAAQAKAFLENRTYCIPDDFLSMAEPVLAHRLIPAVSHTAKQGTVNTILADGLRHIPVPVKH